MDHMGNCFCNFPDDLSIFSPRALSQHRHRGAGVSLGVLFMIRDIESQRCSKHRRATDPGCHESKPHFEARTRRPEALWPEGLPTLTPGP